MGDDVFYSGTVGAAREATFFGVHAIAMSLAARADLDYSPAARFARRLLEDGARHGLPERTLLNVNVPPGRPTGVAITVQGRRSHEGTILEGLDPRRRTYYWIEEGRDDWVSDETSATSSRCARGLISVSPLQTDTTQPPSREPAPGVAEGPAAHGRGVGRRPRALVLARFAPA